MNKKRSNDGLSLIASSYDGSIAILQFTEQEFGKALKSKEVVIYILNLFI